MQGYELEPDAQAVPVPVLGGRCVLGPQVRVALAGIRKGTHARGVVQAVRDAVLDTTDFRWLSKGDTVFVKTANSSPFRYPATTHPLAVVAVAGLLREKGRAGSSWATCPASVICVSRPHRAPAAPAC